MANQATTLYRICNAEQGTETSNAVRDLWNTLQSMNVNTKNIWLNDLAKYFGIDYEAKGISVRGHIYWAEYDEEEDLLSLETESAWDRSELIEEINHVLGDVLSVSFRVCECGCEVYYVHDEGDFFTEECVVCSDGTPFDEAFDDPFDTVKDAINEWCEKMNIKQGERTDEEMVDFINEYDKYDDDCTYFYIHTFTYE